MPFGRNRENRRELRRKHTRAAILEAGREVFMELGFEACSIRDIIRRTELAPGTFYNHFDTKEAVLIELVGEEIHRLTERMRESRSKATSLYAFVLGAYRETFRAVVTRPDVFRLVLRNESVVRRLYTSQGFDANLKSLRDDMQDAVERGILPPINVDWLAAVFFGAGYQIASDLLEKEGDISEAEAAAEFCARLFLGGVQAFSSEKDQRTLKLRLRAAFKKDG